MSFKMNPLAASVCALGAVIYSVVTGFLLLLYIYGARSNILLGMAALGIGLVSLLFVLSLYFKREIVIDAQGVREVHKNKVKASIPWQECAEIGLYKYYYGRHLMVYFSKKTLTQRQILYKRPRGTIELNYSDEVLAQIKKYVPNQHIRNDCFLHK